MSESSANAAREFDLHRLLSPVTEEVFLSDYRGQKPLVIARDEPGYFSSLMSLADVDAILCDQPLSAGDVRTYQLEQGSTTGDILDSRGDVVTSAVYEAYAGGATIILEAVHQRSRAMAQLCLNLATRLQHRVAANLYLSPRTAQGFPAHYDSHDVFIVQLAGFKRWRIYDAVLELPSQRQVKPYTQQQMEALGEPLHELEVAPGDVLYIPRGFVHEAITHQRSSLHVTVGLHSFYWSDLLEEALAAAVSRNMELRRSLPRGLFDDHQVQVAMRQQFDKQLRALGSHELFDEALARLEERFVDGIRPVSDGHLAQLDELDDIKLETVLRKREGTHCRVFQAADSVGIQFPGGLLKGPPRILASLQFIRDHDRFAVREIPGPEVLFAAFAKASQSEPSPNDARLVLARRLMRVGLLRADAS